jgi:hypothetical protein
MLARSATEKRLGVDGMAALRFHICKQTRPCRFCPRREDELRRPQQNSSTSLFGRHDTGSAIQRLMSDSRQPAPLTLILTSSGMPVSLSQSMDFSLFSEVLTLCVGTYVPIDMQKPPPVGRRFFAERIAQNETFSPPLP